MIEMLSDMTVELRGFDGGDDRVVQSARVSTEGAASVEATAGKGGLIKFLMRESHLSPLEHSTFTFYVHAPIFVVNQMVRHRSISFNVESGRYRELEPKFYTPREERPLVQVGKTGNYDFEPGSQILNAQVSRTLKWAAEEVWSDYTYLLEMGAAKEVARTVLPLNIYTSLYATVNARGLMNFLQLRNEHHAQYEIRDVAQQMETFFEERMPLTYDAFRRQ